MDFSLALVQKRKKNNNPTFSFSVHHCSSNVPEKACNPSWYHLGLGLCCQVRGWLLPPWFSPSFYEKNLEGLSECQQTVNTGLTCQTKQMGQSFFWPADFSDPCSTNSQGIPGRPTWEGRCSASFKGEATPGLVCRRKILCWCFSSDARIWPKMKSSFHLSTNSSAIW